MAATAWRNALSAAGGRASERRGRRRDGAQQYSFPLSDRKLRSEFPIEHEYKKRLDGDGAAASAPAAAPTQIAAPKTRGRPAAPLRERQRLGSPRNGLAIASQ
jgi:hypothetical protein